MTALRLGNEGLWSGTRGRVVALLRRGPRTVEELARDLTITDNAVRAHLVSLERDGLVRHLGARRTAVGKPPRLYSVAPEAERLFSGACGPVLAGVLEALAARLDLRQQAAVMRATGRGLARQRAVPARRGRAAVAAAAAALRDLGALIEVEDGRGTATIWSHGCPFGALSVEYPLACRILESFVGELTRLPTRNRCDRSAPSPRCRFEVELKRRGRPRTKGAR